MMRDDIDKELRRMIIQRQAHGKMIKYILHSYFDSYWGENDEDIANNIDMINDTQFADTDPNNIYEDGIQIDGYFLYAWDVVWSLSGNGMIKDGMKFEDALRHDHIEGHEDIRNKMRNKDIKRYTIFEK